MKLTEQEQAMFEGEYGWATKKAIEILVTLGEIYSADNLIPVVSVQIAGVSYDNLGEAGLDFLDKMAKGGGEARVLTTLNPAGMDIENWEQLGISEEFAENQKRVLDAFARMKVINSCTCTPYLSGNLPTYGNHIAWAESSAVAFANSVLGARTNREGGPSALAASLTGRTPAYGYHLTQNRSPDIRVDLQTDIQGTFQFGALGKAIGEKIKKAGNYKIPFIDEISKASLEELKSFSASIATYGGVALFHISGLTPEADLMEIPDIQISVNSDEINQAIDSLTDEDVKEIDFVSLGCPHLSINEIAQLAVLLKGKKVNIEFWITTSRFTKEMADRMGYTELIEASGAKFAADTCCVVAPIKGRFKVLATDSAKACYYAYAKNQFKTVFLSFEDVVRSAVG